MRAKSTVCVAPESDSIAPGSGRFLATVCDELPHRGRLIVRTMLSSRLNQGR